MISLRKHHGVGDGPLRREPHRPRSRLVRGGRPGHARGLGEAAQGNSTSSTPRSPRPRSALCWCSVTRTTSNSSSPAPRRTPRRAVPVTRRRPRRRPPGTGRPPAEPGLGSVEAGGRGRWPGGHRVDEPSHPPISIRTSSPGLSHRGGSTGAPTPAGVPVASTSPGSSGKAVVRYSTMAAQPEEQLGRGRVLAQIVVHPGADGQRPGVGHLVGGHQGTGPSARGCRRTCPW